MGQFGPGSRRVDTALVERLRAAKPKTLRGSRAARVIRWIEAELVITSGRHAGRPFKVRKWQRRIIEAIYATDPISRLRLLRTALLTMGRKNGKTGLAAALSLVHLAGPEAIQRGQVVSAAADRPQAALVYLEMRAMAAANAKLGGRLIFRDREKTMEDAVTGSTYAALSSDAKKAHGLSPSFAVCDEVAQWRRGDLLDAIRLGQGAHDEPLCFIISTRSPDADNPLEELIRYGRDIEAGIIDDPTFRAWVFSADLDDDPFSPQTWLKANPALGDFRSLEDVAAQAREAQRMPSRLAAFKAYVLNMPVATDERFIAAHDWDACEGTAAARGPCFGGLDLAGGSHDLTAFSLFWPETGLLSTWAFMPAEGVQQRADRDGAPYAKWAALGHVLLIPGRVIDKAWLLAWMAEQCDGLDLRAIGADSWGFEDLAQIAENNRISLPLRKMRLGFKTMSPALGHFEGLILSGHLKHNGSPILRWSLANAAIVMDKVGNRQLDKKASRGRIDPVVSAVEAVAMANAEPAPKEIRVRVLG